jgi:hypothetical protein
MDPQLRDTIVTRRKFFWIALGAFILMLSIGVVVPWLNREIQFDSALWQQQKRLRPRMIHSLLGEYQLLGISRGDVDEMLGKPSGRDSIREGNYIYWAGTDGGIDDMWLEIDFENDIVTATRYLPD